MLFAQLPVLAEHVQPPTVYPLALYGIFGAVHVLPYVHDVGLLGLSPLIVEPHADVGNEPLLYATLNVFPEHEQPVVVQVKFPYPAEHVPEHALLTTDAVQCEHVQSALHTAWYVVAPVGHVLGASAVVEEALVPQPKNLFKPFVIFVLLFEDADESQLGNDILESVAHVVEPSVVPVYVVPALFLIVPVPPFFFNVIVFVFAVAVHVYAAVAAAAVCVAFPV